MVHTPQTLWHTLRRLSWRLQATLVLLPLALLAAWRDGGRGVGEFLLMLLVLVARHVWLRAMEER